MRKITYFILAGLMAACGKAYEQPDTAIPIQRLDSAVASYSYSSPVERAAIIDSFRPGILLWQTLTSRPSENIDSFMSAWASSRAVEVFTPDISEIIPTLDDVESRFGLVAHAWRDMLVTDTFPSHFYAVVSPYTQSVFVADSVVLIGLNHYLGAEYPGYDGMERYVRERKIPDRIVFDIAEALIRSRYPYISGESGTALSRMIYEGSVVYTVMRLTGERSADGVLGYDENMMKWITENEERVWRKMIEADYLYSTDPDVASRLVRLAPSTPLIHSDAPGAVGRYIGYRIIDAYMDIHPDTPLPGLFSPMFYGSFTPLRDSRYNGK